MARLPSITRAIQRMLQENMLAIEHKMANRPMPERAEPYPESILAQLEVMARINAINLKADPQTKDSEDDAVAKVPIQKARAAFVALDAAAPPRAVNLDDEDEK